MQLTSSLKLKIVLFSAAMVVIAVVVSTFLAYEKSKEQLKESLANELLAIANSSSLFIDADLHDEIIKIDEDLIEGLDAFETIRLILANIKNVNNLSVSAHGSPIYTMRKAEGFKTNNLLEFVVMSDTNNEGEFYIGYTIKAEAHHLEALNGKSAVTDIYKDSEGSWISASAPILYEDGEVMGIVQVDRNVSFFYKESLAVAKSLAIGSIFTILIVAVFSYLSTGFITKPIKIIAKAARRLGSGDYSQRIEMDRSDEIGVLANTFNNMIIKLEEDKCIKRQQQAKLQELTDNLQEVNEGLENKVEERTKDLKSTNKELENILGELKQSQANLVQSEKMASLGQLAAGVAHEINNPMAFIASNMKTLKDYVRSLLIIGQSIPKLAEIIEEGDSAKITLMINDLSKTYEEDDIEFIAEDASELLDESIKGADRVKDIVMNLKGFSRVDNEGMQATDLNECIASTIKVAHNETKYKCEVKSEFAELPPIQCNPGKLNQVFLNIIVNAAHAIEEKGIVAIKTYADDECAYIEITDNGCGIPQENIDKLFDAFFTTKPVGKGTGLGLYISFGIVEEHKGEINIQSVVGEGTTFQIKLPIKQPETETVDEKEAA